MDITTTQARHLLAALNGRRSAANAHATELEQMITSLKHKLESARDEAMRAETAYQMACEMLEN